MWEHFDACRLGEETLPVRHIRIEEGNFPLDHLHGFSRGRSPLAVCLVIINMVVVYRIVRTRSLICFIILIHIRLFLRKIVGVIIIFGVILS